MGTMRKGGFRDRRIRVAIRTTNIFRAQIAHGGPRHGEKTEIAIEGGPRDPDHRTPMAPKRREDQLITVREFS